MVVTGAQSMGNLLINLACCTNGYVFVLTLSQGDIDAIRTRHLLGSINPRVRGNFKILTYTQVALLQGDVHLQYTVPGTDMRLILNVPISSQIDWACPTESELSYIINVEGV